MSGKRNCYKKKPLNLRVVAAGIFVLFGIILIVSWLPVWIWFIILGIALIVFGIKIFL